MFSKNLINTNINVCGAFKMCKHLVHEIKMHGIWKCFANISAIKYKHGVFI